MKNKIIKLNPFKVRMNEINFIEGVVLKRQLTIKETRHILYNILGINIPKRDEFDDKEEYDDFNNELASNVIEWIEGNVDDQYILDEYASDCSDEPLGIWNAIKVIQYLQKIEAI